MIVTLFFEEFRIKNTENNRQNSKNLKFERSDCSDFSIGRNAPVCTEKKLAKINNPA
jgi:hypothetical protein